MRMNQAAMKEIRGNYEEAVTIYLEVIDFYKSCGAEFIDNKLTIKV